MSHPNSVIPISVTQVVPERWKGWEALIYYTALPFAPLKKSTIMLFILIMPCHTLGWHVCCPYCCNMANFLEGSFLKLLWLVFHILLFPWWFVWPHQRLVTNAYLLSWEVTFSLFKPAMCWPFVIWNLVCLRNRHKHPSSLSTEVLREQSVFLFCNWSCVWDFILIYYFFSFYLRKTLPRNIYHHSPRYLWSASKTFETLFFHADFYPFPSTQLFFFLLFLLWDKGQTDSTKLVFRKKKRKNKTSEMASVNWCFNFRWSLQSFQCLRLQKF